MNQTSTVDEVLREIKKFCKGTSQDGKALVNTLVNYTNNNEEYKEEQAEYLSEQSLDMLTANNVGQLYYYIMTFLLQATHQKTIYKELLSYCIADNNVTKETKYFLYNQIIRYRFMNTFTSDSEIENLIDDLYSHIYLEYKKEFTVELSYIPREERNKEFVIVIISQVLNTGHGPTKTLLDRCYILEKYLNKKVYIINTAELLTQYCSIPCFDRKSGSYIDNFCQLDSLTWRDKQFAFLQCPREMPDVSVIREILAVVKSEKPYFILNIGGGSIVNDVCSNIVPTLTIGTVPSGRTMTRGQFQTIGRKITDDDCRWVQKHSMSDDAIIESLFTSAFKEQTHHYTRKDIKLPENRFICIIVGGRLDIEIDEKCMYLLERLLKADIFIAFMGHFDKYAEYADKSSLFRENTIYLGFQDDVLAVNELCDLYINPKRVGGGTSAAEALYKGLPVVTFDFGDVGLGAGADFHVKGYDDMYNQVLRYASDKNYYAEMSRKAKKRAAQLTDSKTEFMRVVHIMEQSEQF